MRNCTTKTIHGHRKDLAQAQLSSTLLWHRLNSRVDSAHALQKCPRERLNSGRHGASMPPVETCAFMMQACPWKPRPSLCADLEYFKPRFRMLLALALALALLLLFCEGQVIHGKSARFLGSFPGGYHYILRANWKQFVLGSL